jgi:ubiquinone/menaquinone biosynthesis C-methylase UbiE
MISPHKSKGEDPSKADAPSLAEKPLGLKGKLLAYLMNGMHRAEYKAVSGALGLDPEDVLIEIGCGSGYFLHKYGAPAASVAGIDHSPDMVALATQRNRCRVRAGRAEIRLGEAACLPWDSDHFTAAVAIATFMFWPEPLAALKEIHRVLRPRGRLVIGLGWNADDGLDHTAHVKKYGIRLYSSREMERLLDEAGFIGISIRFFNAFMEPKAMIAVAMKPEAVSSA